MGKREIDQGEELSANALCFAVAVLVAWMPVITTLLQEK